MKTNQLLLWGALALALVAGPFPARPQMPMPMTTNSDFTLRMVDSMAVMNKAMMSAPLNGDPDHDFCAMMIPHHQGAIDMAKEFLSVGRNPDIRKLARNIIAGQQREIRTLQIELTKLSSNTPSMTTNPAFAQSMMESMKVMKKAMMNAFMNGDPDHDFCAMMIPHHQGVVDMDKAILMYGQDPVVLKLAQREMDSQGRQIDMMKHWLAASPPNAPMMNPK